MRDSIFSSNWHRVVRLKPALREHATVFRHRYRGEDWWIIRDPLTNRQHRLTPTGHFLVARMDGTRTTESIWNEALERLGSDAPSQDDLIALLGDLHNADLLKTDVNPDATELFRRFLRKRRQKRRQAIANPLYLRFPLYDPDRLLRALLPVARTLFNRIGFSVWATTVIFAAVLAFANWESIMSTAAVDLLTPRMLILFWIAYPLLKLLHELAHGLAVKHWGGEVHELGITLLVLLPVPYVDASAAAAFPEKGRRMLVGAMGVMVELLLAALALLVWLTVEPGIISNAAFVVMTIGTVSTVLVNGNPLLKFDGYYVLADAIEIPNLASRANEYLRDQFRRVLLDEGGRGSMVSTRGEACWLTGYGIAAFVYRIVILLIIAFYLSTKFLIAGVALGAWALTSQLLMPLLRAAGRLIRAPGSTRQRIRVYGAAGAGLGLAWLLLFSVPLPSTTSTEGVVWLAERSIVRTGTDCFIAEMRADPGARVQPGDALIRCEDPALLTERDALSAKIDALRHEYRGYGLREQVKRRQLADEMAVLSQQLKRLDEQINALEVRSNSAGRFVPPTDAYLPGRYLHKGELVGYVVSPSVITVRTAIDQDRIELVRERTRTVELRLASHPDQSMGAEIRRQLPAATSLIPSATLSTVGGGRLLPAATARDGLTLDQEVFLVDLAPADPGQLSRIGERAHVRFDHEREALAHQWQRSLKLLLLRHFNV